MIKLEHTVLHNYEQLQFVIEGMRNAMNSWDRSDSNFNAEKYYEDSEDILHFEVGPNDRALMNTLSIAGSEHRKYMRMMPVWVRITAPLYWWKEFDTYKVGTVSNSCSTMHKIHAKRFSDDDFSSEHLSGEGWAHIKITIKALNAYRDRYLKTKDKEDWWHMIQLLPSSYNQTRNVMLNYEVLANIYKQRRNHKLDEWRHFCDWILKLPYSEFITAQCDKETE